MDDMVRQNGVLTYLHGDALGSASLATTVTGTLVSQRRSLPYGETRWSSGPFPTDRRCTGQREEVTLGVYDYGARMYSPSLGRFISADSIVPEAGRPQSWNRYAYVRNNPLRYTDPTGHFELGSGVQDEHGQVAGYNKDSELWKYFIDLGYDDEQITEIFLNWEVNDKPFWNLLLQAKTGDLLEGVTGGGRYLGQFFTIGSSLNFGFTFLVDGMEQQIIEEGRFLNENNPYKDLLDFWDPGNHRSWMGLHQIKNDMHIHDVMLLRRGLGRSAGDYRPSYVAGTGKLAEGAPNVKPFGSLIAIGGGLFTAARGIPLGGLGIPAGIIGIAGATAATVDLCANMYAKYRYNIYAPSYTP